MRRHINAALTSIVVLAAAMSAVSAEQIPSPENGSPGTASCPPFLRTARAGRVADRTADRFERQQSEWNSSGALDYLRDQLVSSLRPELTSPADTAAILTLPRATVDACFPRLGAVLANLTQGSDYERLNAEQAESRKRNAEEQQASNDAVHCHIGSCQDRASLDRFDLVIPSGTDRQGRRISLSRYDTPDLRSRIRMPPA